MVRHVVKALGVVDDLEPHVALRAERDAGFGHDGAPDDLLRAVGMDDHGDHAAGRLAHGNVHTGSADTLGHADGGGDLTAHGLRGLDLRAVGALFDGAHAAVRLRLCDGRAAVAPGRRLDDRAVRVRDRLRLADRAARGRCGNIETALLGVIGGVIYGDRLAAV